MFNVDDPLVFAVITLVRCNGFIFEVSFNGIAKYFNIDKAPNQLFRYRITVGEVTDRGVFINPEPVSYTHLRAHETRHDLVCRLLLEKKHDKKGAYAI